MKVFGVIPARLNSKRLERKILLPINNIPLVAVTALNLSSSDIFEKIIVAIDEPETQEALKDYNFNIVMTSRDHQSGTDRVCEAIKNFDIPSDSLIVNIQADEPFLNLEIVESMVEVLKNKKDVDIVTVGSKSISKSDINNRNVVKVYFNEAGEAIDFLREHNGSDNFLRHIGVYGFRKSALENFVNLERTESEKSRSLEQMRALDSNMKIALVDTDRDSISIDTQEDYLLALEYAKLK